MPAVAGAPTAIQRLRLRLPERRADEARRARGTVDPLRAASRIGGAEDPAGAGHRRDHQAVPGRQHLVVERRTRPAVARLEQHRPGAGDHVDDVVDRPADARGDVLERRGRVEQVLAGELLLRIEGGVAAGLEAEAQRHDARVRLAEQRLDLALRPDVERALGDVRARLPRRFGRDAVGVLGRIEAAAGVGQIAIDVDQGVVGDRGEQRIGRRLRRFDQREHELRLVVEHLLEVRHAPALVDRVAMEAAADVIADSALGHRREGGDDHVAKIAAAACAARHDQPGAEQQEQLGGARELRRAAEPAEAPVEGASELIGGVGEGIEIGNRAGTAGVVRVVRLERGEPIDDHARRGQHLGPLLPPDPCDLAQQVDEAGPSPAPARREVGAAMERLQVGGQPDAHRPAALSRRRLDERHVDAIDVGPFLAIDLDRDARLVEDGGDRGVLERLALHDVAPVARRVADRQEDRQVAGAGGGERVFAPRKPVDRILRVLAQVRAGFAGEPVGHAGGAGRDNQTPNAESITRPITRRRRSRPKAPPRERPRCRARWRRPASSPRTGRAAAARRPP